MSHLSENNFIKAVKYIYENIDRPISLEMIAKEVDLSVSSLKRLFLEATENSVGSFIRRIRMEHAFRTLADKQQTVLEVALSCGFEDHSAFSRAFKKNFGYPPTFARQTKHIVNELESVSLEEPEIVEINDIVIQSVTEQGIYFEAAPRAWEHLKQRLNESELDDDFAGVFIGIGHDNPHDGQIPDNKVRFSAGVAFCEADLKIDEIIISKGVYAKFDFIGKLNNMGLAYHYIYGS